MIRFFDMFSGIDGFTGITRCELGRYTDKACKLAGNVVTANVVHTLGLRLKAAHRAVVGATEAGKECL